MTRSSDPGADCPDPGSVIPRGYGVAVSTAKWKAEIRIRRAW